MPYPSRVVEVPDVDSVNPEMVKAFVEFHEYRYVWPEKYFVLAHLLIHVAADILGDDSFLAYILSELMLPVG